MPQWSSLSAQLWVKTTEVVVLGRVVNSWWFLKVTATISNGRNQSCSTIHSNVWWPLWSLGHSYGKSSVIKGVLDPLWSKVVLLFRLHQHKNKRSWLKKVNWKIPGKKVISFNRLRGKSLKQVLTSVHQNPFDIQWLRHIMGLRKWRGHNYKLCSENFSFFTLNKMNKLMIT